MLYAIKDYLFTIKDRLSRLSPLVLGLLTAVSTFLLYLLHRYKPFSYLRRSFSFYILNSIIFPGRRSEEGGNMIKWESLTLYVPSKQRSKKAVMYLHGNGEDIGELLETYQLISRQLNAHVFALEYPTYGPNYSPFVYSTLNLKITHEAKSLFRYLIQTLHFQPQDIIVLGRSIGSGPACQIAASENCKTLILIHPFLGVKNLIGDYTLRMLAAMFSEPFDNLGNIKKGKERGMDMLVIHGMRDEIIPVRHSEEIRNKWQGMEGNGVGRYVFPPNMTHNRMDWNQDVIEPIKDFMEAWRRVEASNMDGVTGYDVMKKIERGRN